MQLTPGNIQTETKIEYCWGGERTKATVVAVYGNLVTVFHHYTTWNHSFEDLRSRGAVLLSKETANV